MNGMGLLQAVGLALRGPVVHDLPYPIENTQVLSPLKSSAAEDQLEAGEQLSFLSREATQQDAAHGEIEQHLAGFDQTFVVLRQPPVVVNQPIVRSTTHLRART